jgi:hypothetical protein
MPGQVEAVAAPPGRRAWPQPVTPEGGPQPRQGLAARPGPLAGNGSAEQAGSASTDTYSEIGLAREIRARGSVAGLRPGQIAAEIHDECGPLAGTTWIRAYRLALGVSLADVVAQVRAWYLSEGRGLPRFSETLLSAYESGHKRPGPQYLHYLCAVYRADPPDLGYPDLCFCGRGHREDRSAQAAQATLTGHRAAPGQVGPGTCDPQAGPQTIDTGPEDDDDVLRRQYMIASPLRLLCDVLLDFGDVRRMSERRQPLEFSERLCRLAGRLAGLAGMIMIDVGHQRLARSFFRTARTAADETGDRHLRAWVAVREALVPLYYGDPAEAAALARAGAGLAGRNPCVAGAMAPVLEARSLARSVARRDDRDQRMIRRVTGMLCQAHEALARLPATDRGDTAFGYTERQLLFHEGDIRVMLGDHRGAERAFMRSLELYAQGEILDRSLIALGLARCRLEADEPDEALRLSRETVLSVPRAYRSEIMVRIARSLGESVAARHGDVRAVRDYREALVSG